MSVEISLADGVQIIRINRPEKKNALTGEMYTAMSHALGIGNDRDDIAVHVFFGSDEIFTAGNDLNDFLGFAQQGSLGEPVLGFLQALATCKKPMIAGVNGAAVGVGTTMLFHCDMVFASERAQFKTPFLDLGLVPEAASSLLMPRHMGYHRAFEMLCLGNGFDAASGHAAGFVNDIVAAHDLEATTLEAATRLAAKPQAALALARQLMRGDEATVLAKIDEEARVFAEQLRSPEAREAFSAFLEKRPPDFRKLRTGGDPAMS